MPNTGYEILNRHISVSHETYTKLSAYYDLLLKWQSKINLISNDTIKETWTRHFLDSLQLVTALENKSANILDIGSGAGFPGMVLAIYGYNNIYLVESDAKKISFLQEVARITNTNVKIFHGRIEDIKIEKMDAILSRACSSLNQLLNYASRFVSHGTICLFHKGKNYLIEIEGAKKEWSFNSEIIPSVTDPQGVLLKLSSVQRRSI